jgi:uncharacterized protein YjbJ (UPF0337 family)
VTRERICGYWMKAAGAAKQLWGKIIADETLRIHGERDSWIGQMRIESCAVREAPPVPAVARPGASQHDR